jgi:TonB family protein
MKTDFIMFCLCLVAGLLPGYTHAGEPPAEKVYINRLNLPVECPEQAVARIETRELPSGRVMSRTYYINGQLKQEETFLQLRGQLLLHGTESHWCPDGMLLKQADYEYGRLHGMLRTWYPSGALRRQQEYSVGMLQQGFCQNELGEKQDCPEFFVPARFPGGPAALEQFIRSNQHFPYEAWVEEMDGVVDLRLMIDSLGQLDGAMAVGSAHPALAEEAIRIVSSMPGWTPALSEGEPIHHIIDLRIPFRRQNFENLFTEKKYIRWRQIPGDTLYFDFQKRLVLLPAVAHKFMVMDQAASGIFVQSTWCMDGNLLEEVHYRALDGTQLESHGPSRRWDSGGNPLLEKNYRQGMLHGTLRSWWPNGQLKREDEYRNGNLRRGACYDEMGNEIPHFLYFVAAEFPGGETARLQFLQTNLKVPPRARDRNQQGTVFVTFTIDQEGNVVRTRVLQGVSPELDAEALRVVQAMPRWKPQVVDGVAEDVIFNMPVRFIVN